MVTSINTHTTRVKCVTFSLQYKNQLSYNENTFNLSIFMTIIIIITNNFIEKDICVGRLFTAWYIFFCQVQNVKSFYKTTIWEKKLHIWIWLMFI